MRMQNVSLPEWCVHRLEKVYPDPCMSTKQSRQEWVCDHPKRRRSFRVGRQAREKRKITGLLHSSVRSQTPGQGENHRPNQTIGDEGSQDDRTNSNVSC